MKSNYKQLGKIVQWCDERNRNAETSEVLGVSIGKEYMPSVANIIGTDLSNYKLVRKNRFACNPMHVGRDKVLPIALYPKESPAIVSPAYFTFEVINTDEVLPEYLMLLFSTPVFDRNCWFRTDGTVRGGISWDDLCRVELPVPDIAKQRKFINSVNCLQYRISLLEQISALVEQVTQRVFDKLITQEGNFSSVSDWINFNPRRSLSKGSVASCFEMALMPTQGACLSRGTKKPYNGGMRFRNGDTLIARITPCLENGKAAFVSGLSDKEVAFGSTEVIVLESKNPKYEALPYFLVRNKKFIAFATEFLNGSSGRQRVSASQLASFKMPQIDEKVLDTVASIGSRSLVYLGTIARQIEVLRDSIYTLVNGNA